MYAINKQNGYIVSIVSGVGAKNSNATETEYMAVKSLLRNAPAAPDGFGYRLREDLEWELYELPEMTDIPEETTEGDYIAALAKFGVRL